MTAGPLASPRTGITAWTDIGTDSSTVGGTSFTTASMSPVSDRPVYIAVSGGESGSANNTNVPTITGCGLTWVAVAARNLNSNFYRMHVFRACGTVTPGAITIDFGALSYAAMIWSVFQPTGADNTGANGANSVVQTTNVAGVGTTAAGVIAALGDPLNHYVSVVGLSATTNAVTPDAQFVAIATDTEASDSNRLHVSYGINETTCDPTFSNSNYGMISFEVKAA